MRTALRFASILALSASALAAHAQFSNPNFESGTLDGWETLGQVFADAYYPQSGRYSAKAVAGSVWHGEIASFLGREPQPMFSSYTYGSAMKTSIYAEVGSVLEFSWQFTCPEVGHSIDDAAYFVFDGDPILLMSREMMPDRGQTGWRTYRHTVAMTGTHLLGFAAFNFWDNAVPSDIAVDDFSLTPAPVPEPASMAALGLGLAATVRRRRKAPSKG